MNIFKRIPIPIRYKHPLSITMILVILSFILILFLFSTYLISPGYALIAANTTPNSSHNNQIISSLKEQILQLRESYKSFLPRKPYLIVNTSDNQFALMEKTKILQEGKCSTGSYILLKATEEREWLFKTPRGMFQVNVKLRNPVWYKPDWAYIEEGVPIPSPYSPKRYQEGVLGDYALGFGKGYLVHGTVYKRLLGYPVTHGCVRLDDEDMREVFVQLNHGSKIFIY